MLYLIAASKVSCREKKGRSRFVAAAEGQASTRKSLAQEKPPLWYDSRGGRLSSKCCLMLRGTIASEYDYPEALPFTQHCLCSSC